MNRPSVLAVAVHEIGHAVARLALDEGLPYPGPMIKLITIEPELWPEPGGKRRKASLLGAIDMDPRVHRMNWGTADADALALMRLDVVETWAGPMAEWRHRVGWLAAYSGLRARIPHFGTDAFGDDAAGIWLRCCHLCPPHPDSEAERALHDAEDLVDREWRGIRRMARILIEARTMDGEMFETEWRRVRR